jgi:hypothetical protein
LFIVQSPRRVAYHHVYTPCFSGVYRVKNHTGGIRAFHLAYNPASGPARPYLQLVGGGGPEGVRGTEQHFFALFGKPRRQFADTGRLSRPVYTGYQRDAGPNVRCGGDGE